MTDKLPPNLLALFAPRPGLRYINPTDHPQQERRTHDIEGVGAYVDSLKDHEDDYQPTESWLQKRDRVKTERKEATEKNMTEGFEAFKPSEDPQVRGDPLRTLFVSRLSYDTETKDLEREFGRYGPIERIRIVENKTAPENATKKQKFRGYAFIVYERERDMKVAYKESDNIMIKNRRVKVDVERGRTVAGWRPRRFGGGLGGRDYTKVAQARPSGFGGGFAPPGGPGGFRGGGIRGGGGDFRGGGGFRGGGFRGGAPRGGFGDRGGFGGADRGGYGGGRGGIGYQPNGFRGAPDHAPAGPRGGGRGGYGGYGGGGGGGRYEGGGYGGGRRDDPGATGSNMEPVRPRERAPYRDRDGGRDGGYDDRDRYPRKREYEGDQYDSRSKRRY